MTGSQNDSLPRSSNRQSVPTDAPAAGDIYKDEINLIDYFKAIWKWKVIILFGSVLPALAVGLTLFCLPRTYAVNFVYRGWNLTNQGYETIFSRFYSGENIENVVGKLHEAGLHEYAERFGQAGGRDELKKFVQFDVVYSRVSLAKPNVTVSVTDMATLEKIRESDQLQQLKSLGLNVEIFGRPKSDIRKISLVIRDALENVLPVFSITDDLEDSIREVRMKMADIEANRFQLELALNADKSIMANLKSLRSGTSGGDDRLPTGYELQVAESIIRTEGQIEADKNSYDHYQNILALNKKLLDELKNKTTSYYTTHQFHAFLTDLADEYDNKGLRNYLSSYIKEIEDGISASTPVTETPEISAIAKGTVKKSAIVFIISLMISVPVAFSLEGSLKK